MRLILVRHGDAFAGFHGPIGGARGCRGLTELGREQAHLLRRRLERPGAPHVDVVVSSMIPRAVETATIAAPGVGATRVVQDCALCEVHTGAADGVDWADYPERFGSFDMVVEPDRPFAPGGDSWHSFHRRVDDAMAEYASSYPGRSVLAFCHAGVIAASLRVRLAAAAPRNDIARLTPRHTGLTEWHFDEGSGQWTLTTYDDASHLGAGEG